MERQIQDPLFLGGTPLSFAKQIVHVDVGVLQPVRGRLRGGGSVIGIRCRQVNGEGRGWTQGVGVGVIYDDLGCGVEEFR